MLKKFFNRLKKNPDSKKDEEIVEAVIQPVEEICITEEEEVEEVDEVNEDEIIIKEEIIKEAIIDEENIEEKVEIIENLNVHNLEDCIESNNEEELDTGDVVVVVEEIEEIEEIEEAIEEIFIEDDSIEESVEVITEEDDEEYITNIKIVRGKSIRAIDVYTEEELVFKTHKECSRKLKLPLGYIVENLKYGYTDYLGEAINYLSKELQSSEDFNYLESNKTPIEIFSNLNNKIFTAKISESKRDDILSSEKIEPVKMHYRFECIDEEYDEYFEKYKSIIKRGGKKKIELVDKSGEAIEIFKSLDECASFLGKDKNEVVDMLKYKNTKVGRNEIRYSLRNI